MVEHTQTAHTMPTKFGITGLSRSSSRKSKRTTLPFRKGEPTERVTVKNGTALRLAMVLVIVICPVLVYYSVVYYSAHGADSKAALDALSQVCMYV